MTPEIAAATLMLHCEDRLIPSLFQGLSEEHLRAIGNLLRITKVAFVLHWLDGATRRPQYAQRAQQILTLFQIIFDPDMFRQAGSEETEKTAKFLAQLATTAFGLADFAENQSPEDPAYYTYLNAWSRDWLAPVDENENTVICISDQFGLPLAAILLSELAEIRKMLAKSIQAA